MAYGDGPWNARFLSIAIRKTFHFSGRSRRTEVAWYWSGSGILVGLGEAAASYLLSEQAARVAGVCLIILSAIPWFALLTRRLHDHDMSGWWTWLLVGAFAIGLPKLLAQASPDVRVRLAHDPPGLLTAIGLILLLAIFGLIIAPETIGPNRFGPDPREGGCAAASE